MIVAATIVPAPTCPPFVIMCSAQCRMSVATSDQMVISDPVRPPQPSVAPRSTHNHAKADVEGLITNVSVSVSASVYVSVSVFVFVFVSVSVSVSGRGDEDVRSHRRYNRSRKSSNSAKGRSLLLFVVVVVVIVVVVVVLVVARALIGTYHIVIVWVRVVEAW